MILEKGFKFERYSSQPLLRPEDVTPFDERFEVLGVFNPGVTEFEGKTLLLLRVAVRPKSEQGILHIPVLRNGEIGILSLDPSAYDCSDSRFVIGKEGRYLTSMSYFQVALSEDGVHFTMEKGRTILPQDELEAYGIEDPRIICMDGYYYILYSAASQNGICVKAKRTKDFRSYEDLGAILHPDNKDAAFFPERIGGKYYMLHRPSTSEFGKPDMWIAESSDLRQWGNHRHVAGVLPGRWDGKRMGSSGVPIRLEEGWLVIYHGADETNAYALGAMLLDKDDPHKVLARTKEPLVVPTLECEKSGFFANVVFACGGIVRGDSLVIYYGAADKYVCGGEIKIKSVMESLQ